MKKFLLFTLALISFGVSSTWAQSWNCAENPEFDENQYSGNLVFTDGFYATLANPQSGVKSSDGKWGLLLRASESASYAGIKPMQNCWSGTVVTVKALKAGEVEFVVLNDSKDAETLYKWTNGEDEAEAITLAAGENTIAATLAAGDEFKLYAVDTKSVRLLSINGYGDAAFKALEKNQVVYLTKDTVDVSLADADLVPVYAANGVSYVTGNNGAIKVLNYLSKAYADAETGVSFPQGYYLSKRQNNMEYYYVKNCKQVIIYNLSGGQTQAYIATLDDKGNAVGGDKEIKKSNLYAPGLEWSYQGNGNLQIMTGVVKRVLDIAGDYAGEADEVDVCPITDWSADQVYRIGIKKGSYQSAIVFVAADGTETVYLCAKDGEAAAWTAEATAAPGSYVQADGLESRGKLFAAQTPGVTSLVKSKVVYTTNEVNGVANDALIEKAMVAAGTPYFYTPGNNNMLNNQFMKKDYTDPITGFTAKKGLYSTKRVSGWEYYYVKNVKAVITYNALGWQNQVFVEEIPAGLTAAEAIALPNPDNSTNPKANKNFKYGAGAQENGFYADEVPFRFVVSLDGNKYGDANDTWTPELKDADGNVLEWSADKAYRIAVKKGAQQLGIAFVSATEGPVEYLDMAAGENAEWSMTNNGATHTAMVAMTETPSIEDLHYFIEEHRAELFGSNKNAYIALEPGKTYTHLQPTEFPQGYNVKIFTEGEAATITPSANGNFIVQDGIILKNINIDATALKAQGLIALSDTPSENITAEALGYKADGAQDAYIVEGAITIDNCKIKNLEKSILYGGKTQAYVVKQFNLTNNMIQLCNEKETFIKMDDNADNRGTIANLTIKNNTIWNTKENKTGYFLRFKNSSNAQPQKALGNSASFTYNISNNTLVRTMTGKDFANNLPNKGGKNSKGENFITTIAKNNVFYDVFRVYQYAQTQTYRDFQNNTIWWDKASKQDNDVSRTDSNGNPLCVEEDEAPFAPAFETVMDFAAENCGVNFTVGTSSEAAYLQAGDPRWLAGVEFVEPLKYKTEGQVGSGIEDWTSVFTEDMTVPVEVYRHYAIIKGFAGAEGYDLKVMVPATNKEGSYKVALIENGVESEPVYNEYIMTYTGVADPYYVALYPGKGAEGELYTSAVSSKDKEVGGYFCCHGFAYPADGGEGVWTYYYVTWPKSDIPVVIENATNNNAAVATPAYNLAGQKVGADYKGIVIKDGKKFMVK